MLKQARILLLMDYAAPYKGNFIPSVLNLSTFFTDRNNLIFVFPNEVKKCEWLQDIEDQGIRVFFIDRTFLSKKITPKNIFAFAKLLRQEKIDIIHTHFVAHNYNLFLLKNILRSRVKILANFMNEYVLPENRIKQLKIFVTKNTFTRIIASSIGVENSLLKLGFPKSKIACIYNALDPKHLNQPSKVNFFNNSKSKIILMFGRPYHRKGVDLVFQAVQSLNEKGLDIRLVIAVAGGMEIIENQIIHDFSKLPSWLKVIGPTSNIASYYNAADVFASASREEGFTYSILEAAYCSPLLIVSKIDGHPQDIPSIEIFDYENVNQLKYSIRKLLNLSLMERIEIKKQQRKYVLEKYNVNDWSRCVLNVYNEVI